MSWQKPQGWGTFMGKRLLTLVLDAEKLRNFQLPSKDRASVDALWMCMHLSEVCVSFMRRTPVGELYISAWASALLVLTAMGNAKASQRGTGNSGRPTLFRTCI